MADTSEELTANHDIVRLPAAYHQALERARSAELTAVNQEQIAVDATNLAKRWRGVADYHLQVASAIRARYTAASEAPVGLPSNNGSEVPASIKSKSWKELVGAFILHLPDLLQRRRSASRSS